MNVRAHPSLQLRVVSSPVGDLLLVVGPGGLRALLWPGEDGSRIGRSLATPASGSGSPPEIAAMAGIELAEYFAGSRRDFDLPLDPVGTQFQLDSWQALRAIPFGRTSSYSAQAQAIGRPTAVRAVGGANRANPISIIVPCHRVVGRTGALTGFAGGVECKRWLLEHEQAVLRG